MSITTLDGNRNKTPIKDLGLDIDAVRLKFADVFTFIGTIAVVVEHKFELSGVKLL